MAALNTISVVFKGQVSIDAGITADFANATHSIAETPTLTISTCGTGADSANQYWSDQRTLSASANETLDLYGGLTNALGQTCNFARIKFIYVRNRSTTGDLLIGAATNPWATMFAGTTPQIQVRRGGFFMNGCTDATAWAVTNSTGDNLKITNSDSSNTLTYDIVIIGEQ